MKKIVSLVLLLSMIVCMIPAVSLTASAATSTVTIGSYSDLTAELGSAGSAENVEYRLTANIDCGGNTLDGVLVLKNGAVLNGNGYSITNFKTTSGAITVATEANVTVKNLTVGTTAAPITVSGTTGNVAALIAETDATISFENCTVNAEATSATTANVAGFIANYTGSALSFDRCTVNGKIKNTATVPTDEAPDIYAAAGFVANVAESTSIALYSSTNNAAVTGGYISAGFVGYAPAANTSITMIVCRNTATINGNVDGFAAGFIGRSVGSGRISIDRSINAGWIKNSTTLAGFIAHVEAAEVMISFSQNTAKITANAATASHVGGFTGRVRADATFKNCINTGAISATTKAGNIGQIASKADAEVTLKNCYAFGTFTLDASASFAGPLIGNVVTENPTASGNKYVASEAYLSYYGLDRASDVVAAGDIDSVKANILMNDENGNDVVGAPALRGVQETAISGGVHTIRLLATVDTADYKSVGMTVTTKVNGVIKRQDSDLKCSTLYAGVTAVNDKDGTVAVHMAEDAPFAGKYLMALCLTNVPTTKGVVEIVVTPYGIAEDGTRYEGSESVIHYVYSTDGNTVESVIVNGISGEEWVDTFGANIPKYTDGVLSEKTYSKNIVLGQTAGDADTFKMLMVSGTTSAKYEAYINTLKNSDLCTVTDASDAIDGVSGYWVETDGVRMYTYMVAATGMAHFILENEDRQTTLTEFGDGYNYDTSGEITFYLYGLTNHDTGINTGWEACPEELTHSSVDDARQAAYQELLANSPWLHTADDLAALGITTPFQNQFKNNGMMLVVKLADNSVIIIDGGHEAQMSDEAAIEFNDFLHSITGTPVGQTVTIKAWYLTHPDGDHYQGFIRFMCSFHGQYNMERVMFNLPNSIPSDLRTFLGADYLMKWYPDLQFHRLHTGETIKLGGAEIDVLYTREDCATDLLNDAGNIVFSDGNSASNLLMFRFDGIKVMVTGDMSGEARDKVLEMYENTTALAADVFQAPHHVINDVAALCLKVRPSYILNPQSYGGAMYGGNGGWWKNYNNNLKSMNTSLSDAQKAANNYFAGGTTSMDSEGNVWQVTTSTGISAKEGEITVNVVNMDVKKPGWNAYTDDATGTWINGDWDTFSAVEFPKYIIDKGWGDEFAFGS